ncbi:hypothetical protein M6D81_07755 [Paenibacillus sp. J5C_2022]|uniref:hypothetical protein n=1 Tax=Paenibacillus sp. J5C2022 TaxID=2977129 RepID=UPI0021CE4A7F|nr:hypothetical protein [Paenibacillus sp. J5C2022]MCU6708609.1 hypothetical protein [Paenibacillus sp. J5C2022]
MKRVKLIATIITALVMGGGLAVGYAQYANSDSTPTKISRSEYQRMAQIVIDFNKGMLPISALKDAQLLIEREPYAISKKVRAQLKFEDQK